MNLFRLEIYLMKRFPPPEKIKIMDEIKLEKLQQLYIEKEAKYESVRKVNQSIYTIDRRILALKKKRDKLSKRQLKVYEQYQSSFTEFKNLENDETCYLCSNDECTIAHSQFSKRCADYHDLPF